MKKLLARVRAIALFFIIINSLLVIAMDTSEDHGKKSTKRLLKDGAEETAPKKQKSDQEHKVSAAAMAVASTEPGIQDTFVKYISREPANIVKSYLGWKKKSFDISQIVKLKSGPTRFIQCCRLDRDEQGNPILYIGTDDVYVYKFDLKIKAMSVVKVPCTYTEPSPERFDYISNVWVPDVSVSPPKESQSIEAIEAIEAIEPLSSQSCVVQACNQIVAVNKDAPQQIFALPKPVWGYYISHLSGGRNREGKSLLFITIVKQWAHNLEKEVIPALKAIDFMPEARAFVSDCYTPNISRNACVGKSKNGDCIAYQVCMNKLIAVFNLETGTLKTTFKIDPKMLEASVVCSANDEGYVAVGGCKTGSICVYDENGILVKEFTVPSLCSVDLVNKGRCIVGDEYGVLCSHSIHTNEVQEIGAISSCTGIHTAIMNAGRAPMIVSVNRDKPTGIITVNHSAIIDMLVDQVEEIEEYDRKEKEAAKKS